MKTIPFSLKQIQTLRKEYPTPFHVYDEQKIRENVRDLYEAFSWVKGFKNYFAVKALPNPAVLHVLQEEGCGMDCSSLGELILSEQIGLQGADIMFTSNNTPLKDFEKADELGAIVNFDDITHIDFYEKNIGHLPEICALRFNPGEQKAGNDIIGEPVEAKFGLTKAQMIEAYALLQKKGVTRFGIHTMVASNELNPDYFIETVDVLFRLVVEIRKELGIEFEFVNIGGGLGIPYKDTDKPVDIHEVSHKMKSLYEKHILASGHCEVAIVMESGRYMTGPYGYLVSTVTHTKDTYKKYVGLDATMANLMRPGMYGAYHHVSVLGKDTAETEVYDVTGSLCENNDKFAIDRMLPKVEVGDIVVIHDTGAHGHSMGFQYNAKLRSAEFLFKEDGNFEMIRRAETLDDYFATLVTEA